MFKSRFRGVYKCGKRWKAQLQSQGVQFYLGTFDTEEEAAKAYDRKARDEKGEKGQTNFDDNGDETINTGHVEEGSFIRSYIVSVYFFLSLFLCLFICLLYPSVMMK